MEIQSSYTALHIYKGAFTRSIVPPRLIATSQSSDKFLKTNRVKYCTILFFLSCKHGCHFKTTDFTRLTSLLKVTFVITRLFPFLKTAIYIHKCLEIICHKGSEKYINFDLNHT